MKRTYKIRIDEKLMKEVSEIYWGKIGISTYIEKLIKEDLSKHKNDN